MKSSKNWLQMPTKVDIPLVVERELKRLKRKYPSVTTEVRKLVIQLENDERPGDQIPGVGYDVFKVRLANPSANRGKSGGFRVVYYLKLENYILLLTIYSKTEQEDISSEHLRELIEDLDNEDDSSS